jgi:hypothetical protein
VGWLSLPALPPRQQGRSAFEIGRRSHRYFPELAEAALKLKATGLPARRRNRRAARQDVFVRRPAAADSPGREPGQKLSQETPALYLAFDLLATRKDKEAFGAAASQTAPALEAFAKPSSNPIRRFGCRRHDKLCDRKKWLAQSGGGCDGVIAKRSTCLSIRQPRRHAEDQEIPQRRLRDRRLPLRDQQTGGKKVVGSLLLGLYDDNGLLHHVGFTSAIKQQDKPR